jgi:fructose/tagatose bisphosphate aldolase
VLPFGDGGHAGTNGALTDPDVAAAFVAETGVDALAVSAGNVHILLDGRRNLNLAHLAAIREKVRVPLVLHGGSGIAADSLAKAIPLGVAKVNYGTYLKQRALAVIHRAFPDLGCNPHHALGGGGNADLLVVTRQAVREAVLDRIGVLGCCGRA